MWSKKTAPFQHGGRSAAKWKDTKRGRNTPLDEWSTPGFVKVVLEERTIVTV
jgi:hypothetical protein